MKIYCIDDKTLLDVPVTSAAEHEEELSKGNHVKLSWVDTDKYTLPVGAYIIPFTDGLKYRLLEPYIPDQNNEAEWKYEPEFQHPLMWLSKVPFTYTTVDSTKSLSYRAQDWPYVGLVTTLLQEAVDQINDLFGFTSADDQFSFEIVGTVNTTVNCTFSSTDILSALSTIASAASDNDDVEWHLSWEQKCLYFGQIALNQGEEIPLLKVGENIGKVSVTNTKEGYYNVFYPQGSTRNITTRLTNGVYLASSLRLGLNFPKYADCKYEDGTLDIRQAAVRTAMGLDADISENEPKQELALTFDDVFPHVDTYVYNVRKRTATLKENGEVQYDANGNPRNYSIWYVRLAYPLTTELEGQETVNVTIDNGITHYWYDYFLQRRTLLQSWSIADANASKSEIAATTASVDLGTYQLVFRQDITEEETVNVEPGSNAALQITLSVKSEVDATLKVSLYRSISKAGSEAEMTNYDESKDVELSPASSNVISLPLPKTGDIALTAGQRLTLFFTVSAVFKDTETAANLTAASWRVALAQGAGTGDLSYKLFNVQKNAIIDGYEPCIQFKANTASDALPQPLLGQPSAGEGFEVEFHNADTSVELDDGTKVKEGDYEIVYSESGDVIIPTTEDEGLYPRDTEDKLPTLQSNMAVVYNVSMGEDEIRAAQDELLVKTKEEIQRRLQDLNNYSFPSYPHIFAEEKTNPNLYIGQKVTFDDGAGNTLTTRVIKLTTKIDHPFEQEITVGNQKIKGATTQLKEDVQTVLSGNWSGGTGGGGLNSTQVRNLIKNYGSSLYLSKTTDDTAQGSITVLGDHAVGGSQAVSGDASVGGGQTVSGDASVGGKLDVSGLATLLKGLSLDGKDGGKGIDADGAARLLSVLADKWGIDAAGVARLVEAIAPLFQTTQYTGASMHDQGAAMYERQGLGYLVTDYLTVRIKAIFQELEIRKLSYVGGNYIFSHAGSTIIDEAELQGLKASAGDTATIDLKPVEELTNSAGEVIAYKCRFKSDDGTTRTQNMWAVGDQALCQTFNVKAGTSYNVSNTYYWRLVIDTGTETYYQTKTVTADDGTQTTETEERTVDYITLSNEHEFAGAITASDGTKYYAYGWNKSDDGSSVFRGCDPMARTSAVAKTDDNYEPYRTISATAEKLERSLSENDAPKAGDMLVQVGCQAEWKVSTGGTTEGGIVQERGGVVEILTEGIGNEPCPALNIYSSINTYRWAAFKTIQISPDGISGRAKYFSFLTDSGAGDPVAWFRWRGGWQDDLTVDYGDCFAYGGQTWVWLGDNGATPAAPSEDVEGWQLLAAQGKGIDGTPVTYYYNAGSGGSSQPADSLFTSTSFPADAGKGDYVWSMTVTTYTDHTSTKAYACNRIGSDGDHGMNVHIAYATDDAGSDFSTVWFDGATWIGVCESADDADPEDYTAYDWSRLKGDKGDTGPAVGRNLLVNTDFHTAAVPYYSPGGQVFAKWGGAGVLTIDGTRGGANAIKVSNTDGGTKEGVRWSYLDSYVEAGKAYTISFWHKGGGFSLYAHDGTDIVIQKGIAAADDWTFRSYTFTPQRVFSYIYMYYAAARTFWLNQVKLEEGETATPWCLSEEDKLGADGSDGASSYTSFVFCRAAEQPGTPTGGSYTSPLPTDGDWSDGVPADDGTGLPVWMSWRAFTMQGGADTTATGWSEPVQMTDTADFDVCWHAATDDGNAPTALPANHGTQTDSADNGWHDAAAADDVWMATAVRRDGQWGDWQVVKVKGEDGTDAAPVGRNLLRHAGDLVVGGNLTTSSGVVTQDSYQGVAASECDNSAAAGTSFTNFLVWGALDTSLQKGSWYALSFVCKGSGTLYLYLYNGSSAAYMDWTVDGDSSTAKTGQTMGGGVPVALTGTWTRHHVVFRPSGGGLPAQLIFRAFGGSDASLTQPKLEEGDTATAFCLNEADTIGSDGASSYTSFVFCRASEQPGTPAGGSYDAPATGVTGTLSDGSSVAWSDGVPSGDLPVWMSSCVFRKQGDGTEGSDGWTTPVQMTDTADFDVCWHAATGDGSQPDAPDDGTHPTQGEDAAAWHDTALPGDVWMATSVCHNGAWDAWRVVKVKGESGDDATTYRLRPSATALHFTRSGSSFTRSSLSVSCGYTKTTGSASATEDDATGEFDGMRIYYSYVSSSGSAVGWQQYAGAVAVSSGSTYSAVQFRLAVTEKVTQTANASTGAAVCIFADGAVLDTATVAVTRDGAPGAAGADAVVLTASPSTVILTEGYTTDSATGATTPGSFDSATVYVTLTKGETPILPRSGSGNTVWDYDYNNETAGLSHRWGYTSDGTLTFTITVADTDKATAAKTTEHHVDVEAAYNGTLYTVRIEVRLNWLGTWKQSVAADTMTAVSSKEYWYYDADGNLVKASLDSIFEQSGGGFNATVKAVKDTADGNTASISNLQQQADSITARVENSEGEISTIRQTAESISLKVGRSQQLRNLLPGSRLLRQTDGARIVVGTSFSVHMGTWKSGTAYGTKAVVYYNGNSYIWEGSSFTTTEPTGSNLATGKWQQFAGYGGYSGGTLLMAEGRDGCNALMVRTDSYDDTPGLRWGAASGGRNIRVAAGRSHQLSVWVKPTSTECTVELEWYGRADATSTADTSTGYKVISGSSLTRDKWNLVSCVIDGSSLASPYLDVRIVARAGTGSGYSGGDVVFYFRQPMLEELQDGDDGSVAGAWTACKDDRALTAGNMLRDTLTLVSTDTSAADGNLISVGGTAADGALTLSSAGSMARWQVGTEAGGDYTLSVDAKGGGKLTAYLWLDGTPRMVAEYDGSVNYYVSDGNRTAATTTEWSRHVFHWHVFENSANLPTKCQLSCASGTVSIRRPKLEPGAVATPYTSSALTVYDDETAGALLDTGIDIADRKITLTADNVEVRNNSGKTTALLDSSGKLRTSLINTGTLEVSKVASFGSDDSSPRVTISGGLLTVQVGSDGQYAQFGVKDGNLVLSFYDDQQRLLYNLGPKGIDDSMTHDAKLTMPRMKYWADSDAMLDDLASVNGATLAATDFDNTSLFWYEAPYVGNAVIEDSAHNLSQPQAAALDQHFFPTSNQSAINLSGYADDAANGTTIANFTGDVYVMLEEDRYGEYHDGSWQHKVYNITTLGTRVGYWLNYNGSLTADS